MSTLPPPASLASSTLHTVGTKFIAIPLVLAVNIILARSLGPDGKGIVDLVSATVLLLSMTLGLALPSGVTYVVSQGKAGLRLLVLQLTAITCGQCLLAAALLAGLRGTALGETLLPAGADWLLIGLTLLLFLFSQATLHWRAIVIGQQQVKYVNIVDLLYRVVYIAAILIAILAYHLQGLVLPAVLVVGLLVTSRLIENLLYTKRLGGFLGRRDGSPAFKQIFAFALPCYFANLMQFLSRRMGIFIVMFFLDIAAVGLYSLAVQLCMLLWLIPQSVAVVLLPRVASGNQPWETSVQQTAALARISLWCSVAIGLPAVVLVPYLVPLLFGAPFQASVGPLLYLIPASIIFSITIVLAAYISGTGKPHYNLWVSVLACLITLGLDLVLVPRIGINGAAIGMATAFCVSTAVTILVFRRMTGTPVSALLLLSQSDWVRLGEYWQKFLARIRIRPRPPKAG